MRPILLIALLAALTTTAAAQWETKLDMSVYNPTLSPDGSKVMYFTDDDKTEVHCVDAATGRKLWSRELIDFDQWLLGRFIGNDTVLVGQQTRFEFLNARDGSVYDTLAIAGESWDELYWEFTAAEEADTLRPYFSGPTAVFFWDYGMQVVDLAHARLIYQTEDAPSKIKLKLWETVLMVNPLSGADTLFFVDLAKQKIVYKTSKYDNDLNSSVFQPFAISNGELILFNEDNIQSIDLATGTANATIEIDPDDPEYYTPVMFKNALYLMVSDEGQHSLYRTKDKTLLWITPENAIPGVAEQLVELPNDEGLLHAYDDDGRMMIYKINTTNGKIIWSRHLFTHDGDFEGGHKKKNQLVASIAVFLLRALASSAMGSPGRYGYNPTTGMMDYRPDPFYSSRRREYQRDVQRTNDLYNSWVNVKKSCDGYAINLETREKEVVFVAGGKIYSPASKGEADTYNGEGIFTISLEDGSIVSSQPADIIANAEGTGEYNAVNDLNLQSLDSARVKALIGGNDVYIVRRDSLERIAFGTDPIRFVIANTHAVTVQVNHDDEYYDYWCIDAATNPVRTQLIGRTFAPVMFIKDTAAITTSVRVDYNGVAAFDPIFASPGAITFPTPLWSASRDELETLDYGDVGDALVSKDTALSGIMIADGNLYLLGDDAVAFISRDGSCRSRQEWSPKPMATRLGATVIGRNLMFATGDEIAIASTTCPPKQVIRHELDFSDTAILTNKKDRVVVVDVDEGIFRGYVLP